MPKPRLDILDIDGHKPTIQANISKNKIQTGRVRSSAKQTVCCLWFWFVVVWPETAITITQHDAAVDDQVVPLAAI